MDDSADVPLKQRRTDFQLTTGSAPILSCGVQLCERCGFAGRPDLFRAGEEITFELRQHVWSELTPRLSSSALPTSEKYEFAAKVAAWDGAGSPELGDLWLRAAWCCVDEGDIEAERYYRRHAAWAFEEALDAYAVDRAERAAVTYLVGELWRRIGDTARAADWFERVEDEVTNRREQAWLVQWAKRQRDDPRECFV